MAKMLCLSEKHVFVPVLDVPVLKETGLSSNQSPITKRVWQLTAGYRECTGYIKGETLPLITLL